MWKERGDLMRLDGGDWPTFGWISDVRPFFYRARQLCRPVVLGTLTRVDGPSPRPSGSQMAFDQSTAVGYFSGGCLEADVANHADSVLGDGQPRRLIYGQGSPWIDIRLLCGGTLEIALERIDPRDPAVAMLLELSQTRRRALWSSDGRERHVGPAALDAPHLVSSDDGYGLCYDPPYRVIIVGGDPFALAMASISSSAGFETIIVRRDGPKEGPPIPGIVYRRADPAQIIEQMAPDRWTAVVTATHDDELDDAAILAALKADAGYVGVLGSARRVAARRERLLASGLAPTRIAALHSPIGAARCGKAPWEVAVSVLAEIMQTRTDQSTFTLSYSTDKSETQCRVVAARV